VTTRMVEGLRQSVERPRHDPGSGHPHLKRDLAAIVTLVALVTIPSLFTRDLWNPDEPRYMEVAREMVLLGEYVVPHLNGEVYSDKPPMFFWLAGVLWRAGLGYNSGRIVTMTAVLGTLLAVYWMVRKAFGSRAAVLTAAAALSTALFLSFSKIGVLDPMLMFFTTSALALGYTALHSETKHRHCCWLGCYVLMGLGVLTKGPVGILVPAIVLTVFAILTRRSRSDGHRGYVPVHILGIVLCAAVVLAWLVPALIKGGEAYTQDILFKQNLGRIVNSYSHRRPIFHYLLCAPAYFFPWSLVLPVAVIAAVREWRRNGTALPLFATVWLCAPLVFFSLISGKRSNYIVPVIPALAILIGWYFTSRSEEKGGMPRTEHVLIRLTLLLLAILVTAGAVAVLAWPQILNYVSLGEPELREISMMITPAKVVGAIMVLIGLLVLSIIGLRESAGRGTRRAVILVVIMLALSVLTDLTVISAMNTVKSGKHFSFTVREHTERSNTTYMFGSNFSGVYNLYTGHVRMPVIRDADRLRALLNNPNVLVISDMKKVGKTLTPDEIECYVIYSEMVGHRTMLLLRGRPVPRLTSQ